MSRSTRRKMASAATVARTGPAAVGAVLLALRADGVPITDESRRQLSAGEDASTG